MRVTALSWGVKQSFRAYVEGAGGTILVAAGAERAADGAIVFPAEGDGLTTDADGALRGLETFAGEVSFEAHGGMLSVRLSGLSLTVDADGASLKVADERGKPVEIARLDLAAAASEDGALVIPARLSMDGSYLLGDHYPPRTLVDPVRLTLADG
ncbi:MAG TPA: HtaA domain-containing protein [Phenylobacterium sp.]|nr:HtaA domain-containing protein [Phenylobacterium sp.]